MCLYRVDQKLVGRGTKVYTGWKVFVKYYNPEFEYNFRYYIHKGTNTVPVNQWLKANEVSIGSVMGTLPRYDSGFHIYKYPYPAQHLVKIWDNLEAVKVKFRGVVARGREADDEVIVAREMYVSYRKPGRTQNVNKNKT